MKVKKREIGRLEVGRIPVFERPAFTDTLRFPDDLTQLVSANLSELIGKYAKLTAYVESEATSWVVQEQRVIYLLEEAETNFMRDNPKLLFLERWRIDRKLQQEESVRILQRRLVNIRALKERALSLVRTYDRLSNALSRELSRRLATNDGLKHHYRSTPR